MLETLARKSDTAFATGYNCWCAGWAFILILTCLALGTMTAQSSAADHAEFFKFETHSRDAEAYAGVLKTEARDGIAAIYRELGHRPQRSVRVVLESTPRLMRSRALAEQRGAPPDWADGLAYPRVPVIYLHVGKPIGETLATYLHEVSHIALHDAVEGRPLPVWFKEGLAILQSEPFDLERIWLFSQAAAVSGVLPLDELERGFPRGGQRVGVAYAQSLHFVGFLRSRLGSDGLSTMLAEVRKGKTFRSALESAAGVDLKALEAEWLDQLRTSWGWVSVLSGPEAMWGVAAALLVLGYIRQTAIRRRRLAILKASEVELDSPIIEAPREQTMVREDEV